MPTHQDITGLQCCVPLETKVLLVNRRVGGEPCDLSAIRPRTDAMEHHVQRHLARLAMDGQVANNREVLAWADHTMALERNRGEVGYFEEVVGTQQLVVSGVAGDQRRCVDSCHY